MKHNLLKSVIISVLLLMGVSNAWALNNTFTKGEVLFIYTDNGDAAWTSGACVELWFNDNGTDKGVANTQWLSDYDGNHKLFYAIVPGDGANKVQLQRFASNCSTWWNACGDALQSSRQKDAYNTFYSTGAGNSDFGWKNETFEMYLYGAPNNWAISLGTFAHQGNGVYKYTYRYKTTATSLEFKLKDSKSKWHGNNVSATGLTVGKTYDLTGTVNLANGMTLTMAKSVVSFPVTFASKGTFGGSQVTAKIGSTTLMSGNKYESGQKVIFTASPASGYEIVGWYSDAACTSSLNNGKNTTYTISSLDTDVQVYVKFKETTYSVQLKSADINQGTVSSNVNAGQFTGVTITATPKIGYSFANWTATEGITITNANAASTTIKATKAGTVTANFKAQPSTTVYLKTTANWKDANARFAIYYWGANAQNGWVNMTEVDCNRDYFKGEIPYGSTGFNFVRMNPNALANNWDNDWNQTGNISVPTDSKNCFTITNDHWGEQNPTAEGTWGAFNPTVTLTLKSSSNGTYKITYEGKTYESSLTEDVVIPNLPLDAEIIISESATPNAGYWLKERFIKLGTNEKVGATTNTPYTLCGNTTISANFVTIQPHTVYLNITGQDWASDNATLAIYVYDEADREGEGTWIALTQVGSSKYYTATIPKNESNFNFVRLKNNSTLNWNNKWNQTGNLAIPVTRYNTFTLTSFGSDGSDAEGKWGVGTAYSGDYRLAYVEQVVGKGEGADNWKTVIINDKTDSHTPDDIIRKRANGRDTISLFINVNGDNPEIILQQYDGSKWVDIEAHMVNGPLEADASKAMLPGRKNASPDSDIDDFVYDDGIDAITESGVWNFVIVQDASGNASLLLKEDGNDVTHKYTGNYYIRTNNAAGGWNKYTHPDNIMSRSTYSESGYTHYYCKWVKFEQNPNVKFIVATDYCINVSKEFAKDDYTTTGGVLVENANVRWSWDENTGVVARAYIQGAYDPSTHARLENIVLDYTTDGTTNTDDVTLDDNGDWIYSIDVNNVKVGSTLKSITATYPKTKHTIDDNVINPTTQIFEQELPMLTGGDSENTYTVRVLYDFKIDKTFVALVPNNHEAKIGIDVMIERVNQDETTAVQSTITATENHQFTVCGVMSFTKEHLADNALHNDLRQFYWISFPFNVSLEDVYGFGVYGKHWILETYNGERRAQDGLWLDSPSFWEYILDPKGVTLDANKGYLLCLDSELLSGTSDVFTNTNKISLYFPATTPTTRINTDYTTEVQIPSHIREDTRANRHIYDSNWNLIGVPSYANHTQTTNTQNLQYFYDYQYDNQTGKMIYAPKSISTNEFQSMYAYFVQWGGTLNWSTFTGTDDTPRELAAKRNAAYEVQEHNLRLELQQDYKALDQTFVDMQEDGATAAFDLNKDMTKILNAGANIYTLAGEENIQLAGNSLPIANTVIPVGVQIAKAGEYTFAMPDGTDGITVELIDYETNTRTNLLLSEYTVDLNAGTFETRFALHVKPSNVTTSIDPVPNEDGQVRKLLMNGQLYLFKDGQLYDAQGKLVQ